MTLDGAITYARTVAMTKALDMPAGGVTHIDEPLGMIGGRMGRYVIGLCVAFLLGLGCRFFGLPAPSPPTLLGVLLVVAVTMGYVVGGWL